MISRGIGKYRRAYADSAILWKQKALQRPKPIQIAKRSVFGACDFPKSVAMEVWTKLNGSLGYREDFFFYPTRLVIAFLGSLVITFLFAIQIYYMVRGLRGEIDSFEGKFLELLYSVLQKLQDSFLANFEFIGSFSNADPIFTKMMGMKRDVNMFFQEGVAAIEIATYVGFVISGLLFLWTWLTTFQSFRDDLRRAELGQFLPKAEIAKLAVADCSKYAGLQVARMNRTAS
jgi:hypothetical protein